MPGRLARPAAAVAIVGLSVLAAAGAHGLIEPTETRYAEIARAMRASGDYWVPRLNGVPHFHKPPLPYWSIAAGFAALGENEWGARVPVALASLLALACVPAIVRRRFGGLGADSGLATWALGSSLLFLLLGRSVASDPFLTAAVAAFWALAPSPWALAALGAGFMAKGPVVLVATVLPVLVAAAWARDRGVLRLLGPAVGWFVFAVVALPWYLFVIARTPGLLDYFLGNQLWGRFATTVHQRGGPPWYFVAVLLGGMLPWTPAMIAGAIRAWRERSNAEARLLLCWLVVPLAFLSCSQSKLPAYLLPCLPAAAILAALGLRDARRPWPARLAAGTVLGVTALLFALAPLEGRFGSPRPLARTLIEQRRAGEPVVEFGTFVAGVPFYLRERVPMLDVPRETQFLDDEARRAITSRAQLAALAASHPRVWVVGPGAASATLARELGLTYTAVSQWRGVALAHLTRANAAR